MPSSPISKRPVAVPQSKPVTTASKPVAQTKTAAPVKPAFAAPKTPVPTIVKSTPTASPKSASSFEIPGTGGWKINSPQRAAEKFKSNVKAVGDTIGAVGNTLKSTAIGAAKDFGAAVKNPVEGAKGFFQGAQNMWRDAIDAGGQAGKAALNGGKIDPFFQYRSDQPRNQPQNSAQRGGKLAWDVTSAAVSADPLKGGGGGAGKAQKLQPALATSGKTAPKAAVTASKAESNVMMAQGKVGSKAKGPAKTDAAAQAAKSEAAKAGTAVAKPETAQSLADKFRQRHNLPSDAGPHDGRHVLLGQTTTWKGENTVSSTERSLFKDLENKSVKQLTKNQDALQTSFNGYVTEMSAYPDKQRKVGMKIIDGIRQGKTTPEQAEKALNAEGLRSQFRSGLSATAKDGSSVKLSKAQTIRLLENRVKQSTTVPSRAELLTQYKTTVRDLATLEQANGKSASQIINAAGKDAAGISYNVKPDHISAAHESVNGALSILK